MFWVHPCAVRFRLRGFGFRRWLVRGQACPQSKHALQERVTGFDIRWAPWRRFTTLQGGVEPVLVAVPDVEVRAKGLDVVVAQPCFVVTPACFVEPSKFKPELVVLRPVGEQVSGQFDEEVLVVLAQAFQPTTEDDGGTRVAEVETSATRCEVVYVGP
jgi:hypothetical protein